MLLCPNCGEENEIKSYYCTKCGTNLTGGAPASSMFGTKGISDILFPLFLIVTAVTSFIRLFLPQLEKLGISVNTTLNITGILSGGGALFLSFYVKQPGWRIVCIILSTLGILRFVFRELLDMF